MAPQPWTVGVIGLGSMGGMLLRGILASGLVAAAHCAATTRSPEKRAAFQAAHPGLRVLAANGEVAEAADLLFVCVKPMEMAGVLAEIRPRLKPGCHLVSIAACVSLARLRSAAGCQISRLIPSLASEVGLGVSLVCHDPGVDAAQRMQLDRLLSALGDVKEIAEDQFAVASDLTSCAPGLIAAIFEEYVLAALPHGSFSPGEAAAMVRTTLHGTARLMHEQDLDFSRTIARVATKGGITETGIASLRQGLPAVFAAMFDATLARHKERQAAVEAAFGPSPAGEPA